MLRFELSNLVPVTCRKFRLIPIPVQVSGFWQWKVRFLTAKKLVFTDEKLCSWRWKVVFSPKRVFFVKTDERKHSFFVKVKFWNQFFGPETDSSIYLDFGTGWNQLNCNPSRTREYWELFLSKFQCWKYSSSSWIYNSTKI